MECLSPYPTCAFAMVDSKAADWNVVEKAVSLGKDAYKSLEDAVVGFVGLLPSSMVTYRTLRTIPN